MSEQNIRAIGTSLTQMCDNGEAVKIGSLTNIGRIGLEASEVDITTLDSPNRAQEFMAGAVNAGEMSFEGIIKKSLDELTVTRMMGLIQANKTEKWEVKFPSGATWVFDAFVSNFETSEATVDGMVEFSGSLRITGLPVYTPANV